jgi:hypothetical protein
MVALTVAVSLPLGWSFRRYGAIPRVVIVSAALVSIGLGIAILVSPQHAMAHSTNSTDRNGTTYE